ncbi:MAG TPA: hypothetical protein VE398_00160 [Acidobacteriota bacterium]|nr:hypothetical protein [Acidobacteriota bacterium]
MQGTRGTSNVSIDITPFTRQYLHATPWDAPEVYAKISHRKVCHNFGIAFEIT